MISPTLVIAAVNEESDDTATPYQTHTQPCQCIICHEKFGKIINRPIICFKCNRSFCRTHSSEQRWDFDKNELNHTCDQCIANERKIRIKQRLKNFKLKSYPNGTYINKITLDSFEYQTYKIRKKTKIISINSKNVETFSAQTIANKLNSIDIPFDLTLDFTKCIDSESHTLNRRHSIHKTIGFGVPLSDKSMQRIFDGLHNKDSLVMNDSESVTSSNHSSVHTKAKSLSPNYISKTVIKSENVSSDRKTTEMNDLKRELTDLCENIRRFNNKYNKQKLERILNGFDIQNEFESVNNENETFQKRLNEMQRFKDRNAIIEWIVSLENERFMKYKNNFRFGFVEMGICKGSDLNNVSEECLNGDIFGIYDMKDCQDLVRYFKQFPMTEFCDRVRVRSETMLFMCVVCISVVSYCFYAKITDT